MNPTIPTQATMFPPDTSTGAKKSTRDAADRAWFKAHPGAHARCRLPHDGENEPEGVRLVIVTASGEKRPVREGPFDTPMPIRRWLRFGPDGEVLSQ